MSKKGHSLDLSFTMAYYCQYCVARVKCVTPHVTRSLFLKLHMFKLFPHERLQIKFPLCFTAFFCNLFLSHFLMNTWSRHVTLLTCATKKSLLCDKHAHRPAVMHCHWVTVQQDCHLWNGQQEKPLCSSRIHNFD